jgi:hypothetical protein
MLVYRSFNVVDLKNTAMFSKIEGLIEGSNLYETIFF